MRSKSETAAGERPRGRILWFILIYCASAAAFAAFTYALRAIIPH